MKLAKAALQSGVPRYFPWQFGVDFEVIGRGGPQDIFDAQLDVRELLRGQTATEWVIISTGMFIAIYLSLSSAWLTSPTAKCTRWAASTPPLR